MEESCVDSPVIFSTAHPLYAIFSFFPIVTAIAETSQFLPPCIVNFRPVNPDQLLVEPSPAIYYHRLHPAFIATFVSTRTFISS
jgi:hypothetical protein